MPESPSERSSRWRKKNPIRTIALRLRADARKRAKKKGKLCTLDIDDLETRLNKGICEVSGLSFQLRGTTMNPFSPSLDRIDPKGHYDKTNVLLVLFGINALKGAGTYKEAVIIAEALAKLHSSKHAKHVLIHDISAPETSYKKHIF